MQRPILGIIAVICLDIGFVAYITTNRPTDSALETVKPAENDPVTGPVNDSSQTSEPGDGSLVLASTKHSLAKVTIDKSNHRRKSSIVLSPRTVKKVEKVPARADPLFPSYVFAVQQPTKIKVEKEFAEKMPVDRKSDLPITKKVLRSKKKSFIASVVPIIRKPYDWLKAIASKMK